MNLSLLLFLPPAPALPALGSAHPAPSPVLARSPLVTAAGAPLLLADIVRWSGRRCTRPTPWRQLEGWGMTAARRSLSAPSSPLPTCHPLPSSSSPTTFLSFTLTSAGHRASPKPRQRGDTARLCRQGNWDGGSVRVRALMPEQRGCYKIKRNLKCGQGSPE